MKSLPLAGLCCALLLLCPLAVHSQASAPLPPAPGRWVVPISSVGRYTEPAIAVDPANPLHLAAAFQGNAAVAYSTDGGRTWTLARGTASTRYKSSGDVAIAYDNHGHAILCYITLDQLGTSQYWGHDATRNGIFVRRSLDGGKTWEQDDVPIIEHPSAPGIPFEDKPGIVADDNPRSRYYGNLYAGWTQDRLADAAIMFSRSTDDGVTWSNAIQISHASLPRDDNGMTEGFEGVVTPDGVLHSVWAGQDNDIRYATSRDGGRTFRPDRPIVRTGPARFRIVGFPSRNGVNGYPQIAAVPGNRGRRARLYVTWSDYRNGEVDVFCIHSDDEGKSWSEPVKVNSDPAHDGADHFFQWLAADSATGDVYVSFYDRRNDPSARTAQFVLARSTDGAHSFQNYLWGTDSFDAMNVVLGDYTGLAALNGCVYGVWAESRPPTAAQPASAHGPDDGPYQFPPTVVLVGGADFKTSGSCSQ
ncbi:MAG TPA: sialidase family protein [Candidatus Acidoferrales bacterium]|nr:sialidase family protein [Candidatus Acidoferrales bacterium]